MPYSEVLLFALVRRFARDNASKKLEHDSIIISCWDVYWSVLPQVITQTMELMESENGLFVCLFVCWTLFKLEQVTTDAFTHEGRVNPKEWWYGYCLVPKKCA